MKGYRSTIRIWPLTGGPEKDQCFVEWTGTWESAEKAGSMDFGATIGRILKATVEMAAGRRKPKL